MENKNVKENNMNNVEIVELLQLVISTIGEIPVQIKYSGTVDKCMTALTKIQKELMLNDIPKEK